MKKLVIAGTISSMLLLNSCGSSGLGNLGMDPMSLVTAAAGVAAIGAIIDMLEEEIEDEETQRSNQATCESVMMDNSRFIYEESCSDGWSSIGSIITDGVNYALSQPSYMGTVSGAWNCSDNTLFFDSQEYTYNPQTGSFSVELSGNCQATITPNN